MSERPIEFAVYAFEGLLPELESPPIAARRALDLAGLRLSIESWRSLSPEDRERVTIAGATDVVDADRVYTVARRANPPAQRAPQGYDPDASSPPEALVRALEPGRLIDPKRWAKLRALDRYALSHTYRRAVARSSFMILGEAFDAIVAASAAAAARAPSTRSTSPAPAPPSYQPPGSYSNVNPSSRRTGAPPPFDPVAAASPGGVPEASVKPSSRRTGAPPSFDTEPSAKSSSGRKTGNHPSSFEYDPHARLSPTVPFELGRTAPIGEEGGGISTHLSAAGEVHMVDVSGKAATARRAVALATVRMRLETVQTLARREAPKGEVLATARVAGIMAAKRTPELIPLCHAVALTRVAVDIEVDIPGTRVIIKATAEAFDRTGVEMEAMLAVSVAALTIYDMLKGIDREMVVSDVKVLEKSGGRTGEYHRKATRP